MVVATHSECTYNQTYIRYSFEMLTLVILALYMANIYLSCVQIDYVTRVLLCHAEMQGLFQSKCEVCMTSCEKKDI